MRPAAAPQPVITERAPEPPIRDRLDEHCPVGGGLGAIAQTEPRLDQAQANELLTLSVSPPVVDLPAAPAIVEQPSEAVAVQEAEPEAPEPEALKARAISKAPALVLAALRWTVLGLALGLVGALAIAKLSGHETLTVMSGSMEPTIHTGDVVAAKAISPLDARVGDVLTFQEPHGEGRLITHRVRRMRVNRHKVRFVTKGDANNTVEEWQIPDDGKVARVTNRGWKVGYALAFLRDPDKRLFLISIPAVLLGLFELVRIWRPRPSPRVQGGDHEAAAA